MALTNRILHIELNREVTDIVTAVQQDAASRFLDVRITDGGEPVNLLAHAVRVNMLKPDGRRVYNNCEITDAANGRFQAELTEQALVVPGALRVQFMLFGDGERQVLQTKEFRIVVTKSLYDAEALVSVNEYGAAAILFQDVADVRDAIFLLRDVVAANLDMQLSQLYGSLMGSIGDFTMRLDGGVDSKMSRYAIYTVPGVHTWARPPSVTHVHVTVVNGGNGGGKSSSNSGGHGGSTGAIEEGIFDVSTFATVAVTVGDGGAGGGDGIVLDPASVSSFGTMLTAKGNAAGGGSGGSASPSGTTGHSRYNVHEHRLLSDGGGSGGSASSFTGVHGGGGGGGGFQTYNVKAGDGEGLCGGTGGFGYGAGGGGASSDFVGDDGNMGGKGAPGMVIVRY